MGSFASGITIHDVSAYLFCLLLLGPAQHSDIALQSNIVLGLVLEDLDTEVPQLLGRRVVLRLLGLGARLGKCQRSLSYPVIGNRASDEGLRTFP